VTHPKSLEARLDKARKRDGGEVRAVSIDEAAARLRIGRSTMKKLVQEGDVEHFRIGNAIRIPVKSLDLFIKNRVRKGHAA
jgi:excisionase family DNA binding protein